MSCCASVASAATDAAALSHSRQCNRRLHHRRRRRARPGDIVTIEMSLTPENGFVPEPLFDQNGVITFVLGWGNYLPAIHELVENMLVGETVENVSIDAGWGEPSADLIFTISRKVLQTKLGIDEAVKKGDVLNIPKLGDEVLVCEVNDEHGTVTLDANPALAGSSYSCSLQVLAIERVPQPGLEDSRYEVATFALDCFWAAELAFMRTPGVVGTKVGYSQGTVIDPTYEEVCSGRTHHRESVLVVYDSSVVSYAELGYVALERVRTLAKNYGLNKLFADDDIENSKQYRQGFHYHTDKQRLLAESIIASSKHGYDIELLKAATFYDAEEYHQQYLYKRGQSARKESREQIRCFG